MKFAFRTDASSTIGTGHVMRCATLADELKARGARTVFFSQETPGHLCDWLEGKGHEVRRLSGQVPGTEQEIEEMQTAIGREHFDWLVVDHYGLDAAWERALAPCANARFAIDDIGRPHDCELLLDQNVLDDEDAYKAQVPSRCHRLLGPRFALLRPDFLAARGMLQRSWNQTEHVLISFGGADPSDETAKAIEGFLAGTPETVKATIVLGSANPNRDTIAQRFGQHSRLRLLDYCDDMPKLMASCDLAIGAGGISTWERACLGLPSIVTAIAENQRPIAETLALRGGQIYLGTHPSREDYAGAMRFVSNNSWLRESCANTSSQLVDGRGCGRVGTALWPNPLDLRPARTEDAGNMLTWRNADINRLPSFDSTPITLDQHLAWLKAALENPRQALLIAEKHGNPVGVLRYDCTNKEAEVSIYLVPGCHGKGWGEQLLRAGTLWLHQNKPEITCVRAHIKADNLRSQSVFHAAGYISNSVEFALTLSHNDRS
jgi:UDP-2,4-diacetamido-2,4,6-trideoxy-beta-L-altropyranose hydrolase